MKHLNYKLIIVILLSSLVGILTSYSTISEREEAISRNVEALSRGEGSASNHCIEVEGKCHIYGQTHVGMSNKN